MPPRKRKSNARDDASDGDDTYTPPKEAAQKKPRTQEPRKSQADTRDSSEDDMSMNWEELEAEFKEKYQREREEYLEHLKDKMKSVHDTLLRCFDKSKTALDSVGSRQAKDIVGACQHAVACERQSTGGATRRTQHPLFNAGQEIFEKCHSILECHDKTTRESLISDASPPGDKWQADNAAVKEVISHGRLYGDKLVDCVVMVDSDLEVLNVDRDQLPETANMAIDLYTKSSKIVGMETWGQAAVAQLNAVMALIKRL